LVEKHAFEAVEKQPYRLIEKQVERRLTKAAKRHRRSKKPVSAASFAAKRSGAIRQ
jgi:hypothetical protein